MHIEILNVLNEVSMKDSIVVFCLLCLAKAIEGYTKHKKKFRITEGVSTK